MMRVVLPQPSCLYLDTLERGIVSIPLRHVDGKLVTIETVPEIVTVRAAWVECLGLRIDVFDYERVIQPGDSVSMGQVVASD